LQVLSVLQDGHTAVAYKIAVDGDPCQVAANRAALQAEARAFCVVAARPHRHIASGTPHVGDDGRASVIVLPLARRGTLHDIVWELRNDGRARDADFREAFVRAVVPPLMRGVAHLHSVCELEHGDLKLANVLVDSCDMPPGQRPRIDVQITDLGLARHVGTATCGLSGSHLFRAPEQHQPGNPMVYRVTGGADVYALAVFIVVLLAYDMDVPYDEDDWEADVAAGTAFADHRALLAGMPADLHELLDRMLAADASARPTIAEALCEFEDVQWA
jgi:serine/threonine protein kinase